MIKMYNGLLILLMILNVLMCGKLSNNKKKKSVSKKKLELNEKEIIFEDQSGRRISLKKPAKNMVVLPVPGSAILIAVDQSTKRLKAMHPWSKTAAVDRILGKFFPEISNISTNVVNDKHVPNVEELLKINPDLIFGWGISPFKEKSKIMEEVGLKVAHFHLDAENDWSPGWIEMIGKSIGKMARANQFINWRNEIWKKIENIVKTIPEEDRLRTIWFWKYKNKYQVRDFLNMQVLNINNPSRGKEELRTLKVKPVNAEQILKWNPEIIFLNAFEKDLYPENVYSNKVLSEVSAVKNKQVYKMPIGGYRWDPPSHESPLSWMWLSMILYPDYFNFDLRKEIKKWYKIMYGKVVTEDQIDEILHMKMHKESKAYKYFRR